MNFFRHARYFNAQLFHAITPDATKIIMRRATTKTIEATTILEVCLFCLSSAKMTIDAMDNAITIERKIYAFPITKLKKFAVAFIPANIESQKFGAKMKIVPAERIVTTTPIKNRK